MSEVLEFSRCRQFFQRLQSNALLRQGSPVDDILAFVVAERGRAIAEPKFDEALPLCLYFANEQDRRDFMQVVRETLPSLIMRETL